jgi:hypothetical protein
VNTKRALFAALFAHLAGCGNAIDLRDDPDGEDAGSDVGEGDAGADVTSDAPKGDGATDSGPSPDTANDPDGGPGDAPIDDGLLDTGVDTTPIDTGPVACSSTSLAVDPASSLDPLADGPLKVAHAIVTVPKLGSLTSPKVKIHYPVQADGVTPDPGRHAWVMFHHAVHGPYPGITYDRYDGIFDRWASHGFIVFSIDGALIFWPPPTSTGCPPDSEPSGTGCWSHQSWTQMQTVAGVMDEAITYFLKEQEDPSFVLHCALDPSRLAVAGHSRGGGSALLVPTARTDGATIKAYVGFQPVNPDVTAGAPAPPAPIPLYDLPALWLDSGNDGDVTYPITAMLYSNTHYKGTHVTILGSKHTYTLDTPYPDQGGTTATITPDEHKRVTHYYSVPFLRAYVRDATAAAADLDRVAGPGGLSVASTVSTGDATIRWHLPNADPAYIEKFDEALGTTPTTTIAGGTITLSGGMTATSYETYVTSTSGWSGTGPAVSRLLRSVLLNWGTTDAAIEIPLPSGGIAGKKAIVFETAFLDSPTSTSGTHPLYIELTDTTGASSSLAMSAVLPVSWAKRPRRLSEAYVELSKFTGVDLTKAKSIRFVAKAGTANHNILVDLLRVE